MLILLLVAEGLIFFILRQCFGVLNTNLDISSTIIVSVNTIVYIFVIAKYSKNKGEYILLLFAYFIRILLLYWDIFGRSIFLLPNSGADSEMFNDFAIQYVQGFDEGRGGLYSIIVGLFYKMYGVQRILAQYFNVILSIYTIIIIKRIIEILNLDKKIRYLILLIVCFLPNFIITSSILLRESLIIFLITLSLFYFLKWWHKGNFLSFILAIILPLTGAMFHSGVIAPSLGYALCYIFYNPVKRKYNFNIKTVAVSMGILIIFYVINTFLGDIVFSKFQDVESTTDITGRVTSYTNGGSAYLGGLQVNGIADLILYSPIRMFYFISSPLPWDWRGFNDIFAFAFSGMFYLFTYIYAFRAIKIKDNKDRGLIVALLFIALFSALLFSWGVSNAGSALRHREKFLGIYIILLAVSLNHLWEKSKLKKVKY